MLQHLQAVNLFSSQDMLGLRHTMHPPSNRLAERAVQTFKAGMKEGSLETKLSRFLFNYRLTSVSSTGVSPAELMFGRKLRSPLDCLQPHLQTKADTCRDTQTRGHDVHVKLREFSVSNLVYSKNYVMAIPGKITERFGSVIYGLLLRTAREFGNMQIS